MRPRQFETLEQPAPLPVCDAESRVAVEVQEVEDHVDDRDLLDEPPDPFEVGGAHPRLQGFEARTA